MAGSYFACAWWVACRGEAPVLLHRVPTRKPCILGLVYTHPPPTRRFSVLLYTHPPPTHAKSAKNTVPIATPTITPTLHPGYTQITPTLHPRAISLCRKNVCKNVCVSNMYVDLYAIQLTVLLLDYCTPAEHPHLHPHPRILPNTHTYTHANFGEPGIRNTYTRIQKISGASPLMPGHVLLCSRSRATAVYTYQ